MRRAADLLRAALSRFGYTLTKREFARFGTSLFADLARIDRGWNTATDVVFDVGANAGEFAAEALRELPASRVYSFEPHPDTFRRLSSSVSNLRFSANQIALGDQVGEAAFHVYGDDGDGSLINSLVPDARFPMKFGYSSRAMTVPCTTIDAFCAANAVERVDLLKIDTEGADLLVLRGAQRMLAEGRVRYIYVEFNTLRETPGATGGALVPIADFLAPFGAQYLTTYTDFVVHQREISVCANALFAVPPAQNGGSGM